MFSLLENYYFTHIKIELIRMKFIGFFSMCLLVFFYMNKRYQELAKTFSHTLLLSNDNISFLYTVMLWGIIIKTKHMDTQPRFGPMAQWLYTPLPMFSLPILCTILFLKILCWSLDSKPRSMLSKFDLSQTSSTRH